MDKKYEKIILPPDYQQMPAPALAELGAQMEARVRQIDEQISDAMKKNPNMAPDRFGSIDWHTRARRAQDIYRRDINSIRESYERSCVRRKRCDDSNPYVYRRYDRFRKTGLLLEDSRRRRLCI